MWQRRQEKEGGDGEVRGMDLLHGRERRVGRRGELQMQGEMEGKKEGKRQKEDTEREQTK